ncbi:MAG: sulfur carrier protein ThiS [Endozoicomonadaceae bacterium]|nr:sulfur carrier protein ThiS [Endozoicomonadaceae bacterium]
MNITVNNKPYHSENTLSLSQLLINLAIDDKGTAVALNKDIISRNQWDCQTLSDGDKIIVIKATAGG